MKYSNCAKTVLATLFLLLHTDARLVRHLASCPDGSIESWDGSGCCPASCGTCGGNGCHLRDGGETQCCTGTFSKRPCETFNAPCSLTANGDAEEANDEPNAEDDKDKQNPGQQTSVCPAGSISNGSNNACCPASCGTCGGEGCHLRDGGEKQCCTGHFTEISCADSKPPCTLDNGNNFEEPVANDDPQAPSTPTSNDGDYPVCTQSVQPPGVKPGSCMQITCMPKSVAPGQVFHTTAVWCLQRPRKHYSTINILDMNTKEYFNGTGSTSSNEFQCGEHTFELVFNAKPTPGRNTYDIMWKWFITPLWGPPNDLRNDPFPNMLAETGIAMQPEYGELIDDCDPVPTRFWNLEPTGDQDGLYFPEHPTCITPGQPWQMKVNIHVESAEAYDFHMNLMLGTGGDKYLGTNDQYVTESNISNVQKSGAEYYREFTVMFTGAQTAGLENKNNVYVSAFLTPVGQTWTPSNGWTIIDVEYYLSLSLCN